MSRCCKDCGAPEERIVDDKGRPMVNLSPLTDQCVTCLGKAALARHTWEALKTPTAFDGRAAAARNDE
jgi:hypothetical protein